jgi:hypothetical protein
MTSDVLDYDALLEQVSNSTLAWLANRLTDAPKGTTWPSRESAIRAILDAHDSLPEKHPQAGLLFRFYSPQRRAGSF